MGKRESKIEKEFCEYAEFRGCAVLKIEGRRGWPDRQIFLPGGKVLFIEFKQLGKHASPFQERVHGQLRKLGFAVYVCDTPERAKDLLDNYLQR